MKKLLHILAYGYSVVLYPLFVPTYLMVVFCMLFSHHVMPLTTAYSALAIGGTCFFTCIIPLILLLVMKAMGKIKDLNVSNKDERLVPYLYTMISFGFWCYFLHLIKMPNYVFYSSISVVVVLAIVTVITPKWKISAHLSTIGGTISMLIGMLMQYGIDGTWIIPTLLIMAWLLMLARIYLEAHTPLQTVCGFLLGLIAVLIPNLLCL